MAANLVPVPGEGVADTRGRLAPEALKEQADEIRTLMRSVLQEGIDFGQIPGTPKPTLFKSGAEWLLKWAQFGHRKERVELERDEHGKPYGVTYRCFVYALHNPDVPLASADGYCGYDEPDREAHQSKKGYPIPRAPWNTIIQMAQKRAMVSATLQATAGSGLFTQDVVDEPEVPAQPADPDAPFRAIGWKDRAEEVAWRETYTARGKQLGDDDRPAFKEDVAAAGMVWAEPIPKGVAEQVDKLFAMYLHPAATEPAPEQPKTADEAASAALWPETTNGRTCDGCGQQIVNGDCGCPF